MSNYFIDQEHLEEMNRLREQGKILDSVIWMESEFDASIQRVLDVACGPGSWPFQFARQFPQKTIVGMDISERMIHFAQTQAKADHISNASFLVGDALQPLPFSDASFDYVHARLIQGFLTLADWPRLLRECRRVLRPGGLLRLTECERPVSNKAAYTKLNSLLAHTFGLSGRSAAPDGEQWSITHVLRHLLLQSGFNERAKTAHLVDYSAGTPAHQVWCNNVMDAFHELPPFLHKFGGTSITETERLCLAAQQEMTEDDFCALEFLCSILAYKV